MKFGCSTALFNQLDLYGALQHIAWAGYDGAELSFTSDETRHLELNVKQTYVNEVKSITDKHKIELFAIHTGGKLYGQENIKSMTKLFDVSQKLNIPIVTLASRGKFADKEATKEEFKYFKKLSQEAASRHITLAVKPHVGASVCNTATMLQMLDEIDSPALGINLDTMQIYKGGEDVSETVHQLGKKIVHVHFREYPDSPDRLHYEVRAEEEIPGRGNVDFPKIISSLKKVGYDKVIIFDVSGAMTYPLSRQMGIAAEARGYLYRCLQELPSIP